MRILLPILLVFVFVHLSYGESRDSLGLFVEEYIDANDPILPPLDFILEQNISDVYIGKGKDNTYFLTGTTGDKNGVQDGIRLWASRDLKNWNTIGNDGLVWTFENNGADWQKEVSERNGWRQRGIIAPEIHYINENYWITYTNSNSNQSGILKSLSGSPQGPFVEANEDGPLVKGTHASLIQLENGDVYFLWDGNKARKLLEDMSGFANSEVKSLVDDQGTRLKLENISITKYDDKYVLSGTQLMPFWSEATDNKTALRSDGVVATANTLFGPYRMEAEEITHAGGGHVFEDFQGKLWFTISGSDLGSPIPGIPSLIPLLKNANNHIGINAQFNLKPETNSEVIYVSVNGDNTTGTNWTNAFRSLQRAIDEAPKGAQIWVAKGKYEAPIEIHLRNSLYIYGGFSADETELNQRSPETNKVIIQGRNYAKHIVSISSSEYVRLDGLTIQGGNASGGSFHHHYGGGLHILGGGETIRIVNCSFENNKADQDGGALYVSVGGAPTLINCVFKNNVAKNNGGAASIYCNGINGYHTKFYNCTFENNFAYGDGGAIYFDTNRKNFGQLTLVNSLITNNTSLNEGGAIAMDRSSNLFILNSTMSFNKGTSQGSVLASFGAVPAKTRVVNSIFYQNYGGMLFSIEGEAEVLKKNNTVTYPNVWVQFDHCLFEDNDVSALVQRNFDRKKWRTVYELNESIMGVKCIQGNPAFVDPANGNFRPNGGSKAKNAGTNTRYFKYTIDGKKRAKNSANIGCY